MKICKYCNSQNIDNASFCASCGSSEFIYKCNNCGNLFEGGLYCTNCGVKIGQTSKICPRCGKEYYSPVCPDCGFGAVNSYTQNSVYVPVTEVRPKKRKTWLWVLGWIFIFPLPLTLILRKNTKIDKRIRCLLIAAAWLLFLVLVFCADSEEIQNNDPSGITGQGSTTVFQTETERQTTTIITSETETEKQKETTSESPTETTTEESSETTTDKQAETTEAQTETTTEKPTETTTKKVINDSVSYSSNSASTVQNGDSGQYSYRSNGGTYYVYWIIDFDEGYAYRFCEGNGDGSCDRIPIDYGTLNDVCVVTYHDHGDEWSYGLHFHTVNRPEHLVVEDENGFTNDYYPTDLNDALSLKRIKTIIDF